MSSRFTPSAAWPQRRAAAGASALCAALALAVDAPQAYAQSGAAAPFSAASPHADASARFNIPAGPLGPALTAFAGAARINLSFDPALAEGRATAGLQGTWPVEEGLARLLAGTHLAARRDAANVYTLRLLPPGPIALLPAVRVEGANESAYGPVTGIVALRSATGTKTDTPIIEIPQTVNVVTRDEIASRGARSIVEALAYTPGVYAPGGSTDLRYDNIYLRGGFGARNNLDGARLPFGAYSFGMLQIEPYGLERIEVLKGPSSVLYGQNNPGGLINMVSKLPTATPQREIALQTGSYGRAQAATDLSGPVDEGGVWSYRLVALARDAAQSSHYTKDDRIFVAPALTWRPSAATSLSLLGFYQEDRQVPLYGNLPAAGTLYSNPNGRIPRDRFPGEPGWDRYDREQYSAGYLFTHAFNDTWTVKQQLRYSHMRGEARTAVGYLLSPVDMRTWSRTMTRGQGTGATLNVDTQAIARFRTGAVGHEFLMGLDYLDMRDTYKFANVIAGVPALDLFNPVYGKPRPGLRDLIPRIDTRQDTEQTGIYLQDQIAYGGWLLTLGGRYDMARSTTRNQLTSAKTAQDDSAFTGRAGLTYLMANGLAPYVAYSTSFAPTGGTDFNSNPFRPAEGRQIEAGLKYQPPGSDSLVTLSAYQLTQDNVLTSDTTPGRPPGFQTQTGQIRARGIELEGKANLARGWDLIASYAYVDAVVTRSANVDIVNGVPESRQGKKQYYAPAHQAAAWLGYKVQGGPLQGLGLGAGVRYIGADWGDPANTLRIPAVTLFDAALSYDFGQLQPAMRGLTLDLNASNLFDRTYVGTCVTATACTYGAGRLVLATLKYAW
ncbi:TonB-dependent siderophore receptor [Achromobacter sp. Root565]|uniref:TonB-dependent siderophore receptor n=1 Tax=Achromobacter sp. Root565 TaxID=1736564 RepID=UPI0006F75F26|nr:TonB-dependent siderophore receptor [Achromobacter sp. Root565]KRA02773.1 iron transporter [Achromobacter sp. Root565]